MIKPELAQEINLLHADICSALADPTRILILYALSEQSLYVNDLSEMLCISQPTISRHLKTLRERGLVRPERQGSRVIYHLTEHQLIQALDILREVMRKRIQHRANLIENSPLPFNHPEN